MGIYCVDLWENLIIEGWVVFSDQPWQVLNFLIGVDLLDTLNSGRKFWFFCDISSLFVYLCALSSFQLSILVVCLSLLTCLMLHILIVATSSLKLCHLHWRILPFGASSALLELISRLLVNLVETCRLNLMKPVLLTIEERSWFFHHRTKIKTFFLRNHWSG